jgi:hypothetical protein
VDVDVGVVLGDGASEVLLRLDPPNREDDHRLVPGGWLVALVERQDGSALVERRRRESQRHFAHCIRPAHLGLSERTFG